MTVMRDAATPTRDTLVHSYLFLRRAIGVLGLALPAVLIIGKALLQGGPLLDSISDYVYSDMRGVLIGTMAAFGVFLFSYRGYGRIDDITADVAAVGAIGVALFPTTPFTGTPSKAAEAVGTVHLVSAAIFFAALIIFCLFLFTRSDSAQPGGRKRARNVVYIVCGVIMLACLIAIGIVEWVVHVAGVVLWLESAAVMAFGVAWLVKGETILADRPAG
ncbi:MAG TPA: DUF998 domain-containing protein [Pseudonocardiaceae bacterium]|jgi:hypothetical protein|nr:DUF998 domain-containing protein [Pseudonocardiaceae bacterium]